MMKFTTTVLTALLLTCTTASFAAKWGYTKLDGPSTWGKNFPLCQQGKQQSPINIYTRTVHNNSKLAPVSVNFVNSTATIINDGHTIEVKLNKSNTFSIAKAHYKVLQFHFHMPAEHKINRKQSALVLHIVGQNTQGKLAVIGVLIHVGAANKTLQTIWHVMPQQKNHSKQLKKPINLTKLLPKNLIYYNYAGSLTVPPCTQGVSWYLLRIPITASTRQLQTFANLYPNNSRPTQPLNGRKVQSNAPYAAAA